LNPTVHSTVFEMDQCLSHMLIHSILQEFELYVPSAKVINFGLPKTRGFVLYT